MRTRLMILSFALALVSLIGTAAYSSDDSAPKDNSSSSPIVHRSQDADAQRVEGEQRFKTNCSRCHAAPHKFPPRMMATIVRHMRVRATITDEDMRLILFYMTQ